MDDLIVSDPDILGGTPVFKGTRVPLAILFENLKDNLTLAEIIKDYPTLSRDQAVRALREAQRYLVAAARRVTR
ncbi:DUF433 domain-containing protein [Noviherbaspirillum aridicola]|uniref:DUF433 domain-containing protein n=1 Tax=Noviherbaspirillum aridicola TaxID=2849687 RepID=A0ABQ4Q1M5_9BURK|nr:DUF433 domain-containing protein [Noviherbaspirillum aridicola]GIZ51091.1 hypothetical protein NCCP691_11050 [Noviherbaspirillum aridicola]